MRATEIVEVRAEPMTVELTEPFGIATGAQQAAENLLVAVRLGGGTVGYGEAAPFPAVNGETRDDAARAVAEATRLLLGGDVRRFRYLSAAIGEATRAAPSARAALETALLDAFARQAGLSLLALFGGRETALETDVTIVTGGPEAAGAAAARAARDGFRTLKVKVGGATAGDDEARLRAVVSAAPRARLVLDGNCAQTPEAAAALVRSVGRERVALLEQPTAAGDDDALRRAGELSSVPVAADESARSAADVARLARTGAAQVINVKITKTGLAEAIDMIAAARAGGLGLMIGGMVETELAMSASACLAAGQGGFAFVDLDTPMFMKARPLRGGFTQRGPHLDLAGIALGHGVTPSPGLLR